MSFFQKLGSDTKLMWAGRGFRVCSGDFGEIGEEQGDMITDRNSNLGFTAFDSIHEIKINTESK